MHIKNILFYLVITLYCTIQSAQHETAPFECNMRALTGTPIAQNELPESNLTNIPNADHSLITVASCFASASIALPIVRDVVSSSFYRQHQLLIETTTISLNAFSASHIIHDAQHHLEEHCDRLIDQFTDIATLYNATVDTNNPIQAMLFYENQQRILRLKKENAQEKVWGYDNSIAQATDIIESHINWALVGNENIRRMQIILAKARALESQLKPINNTKRSIL